MQFLDRSIDNIQLFIITFGDPPETLDESRIYVRNILEHLGRGGSLGDMYGRICGHE